jgi:tetratricopeptide (TPR) repeat protein
VDAVSGRLDAAATDLTRSLAISRAVGDPARQALVLHVLALDRSWRGDYAGCRTLADEGIRLAREHRLVIPLIRTLWNEALACSDLGDYDRALAVFGEGLALAEKVGDDALVPRFQNSLGWLRIDCGDFVRGIALSELSYEVTNRSSRSGHGSGKERRAFIRINEGDAWMAQGDLASAAEALAEALHTVQHPPPSRWMTWRYAAHCYASLAQLALLRGESERAASLADQSLEMAVPTQSRKYESWAWRLKGESATVRHRWDEADETLRRALALAESIRQPRQTWMALLALGRLDAACGRGEEARKRYRAAWAVIAGLQERTRDAELRAGLGSVPLIREVADLARSTA